MSQEENWIPLGDSDVYGWQGDVFVEKPSASILSPAILLDSPTNFGMKWKEK